MTAAAGSGRPAYRRILLKLSGEALAGSQGYGIDPLVIDRIASEVTRIPVDLARAREKLWTPGQEKPAGATKLWTPGQEERTA